MGAFLVGCAFENAASYHGKSIWKYTNFGNENGQAKTN